MSIYLQKAAAKIPAGKRQTVLTALEKACNIGEPGTPMEVIFDIYEEFIDVKGEFDDFNCYTCRQHVLMDMQRLKPFIWQLMEQQSQRSTAI